MLKYCSLRDVKDVYPNLDEIDSKVVIRNWKDLSGDKYASDNIRMNNILPGFIDSLPTKEEFLKRIPLKRYGKVSEISSVVEMLASEGGAYITGQNIRVDGGITRSV